MTRENGRPQALCEHVCTVITGCNMQGFDNPRGNQLLRKMVRHLNVLVLEPAHRILRKRLGPVVVKVEWRRFQLQLKHFLKRFQPADKIKGFFRSHK
jgi:hypothetical protein